MLNGIDLTVSEAEVVALIGPSGSGKSTFLRCINRLETPTSGQVKFKGELCTSENVNAIRREIGMVFQRFNLFPHLTALQNVTVAPMRVLNIAPDQAEKQAMELLDRVKLTAKANNFPGELSGGQQQRVAILRAIMTKPKMLLLDEVTSALDPVLIAEVLTLINELKSEGITMIIATHEMGFAKQVADQVLYLKGGRIIESGSPKEIFESPKSDDLKEFLGALRSAGRLDI